MKKPILSCWLIGVVIVLTFLPVVATFAQYPTDPGGGQDPDNPVPISGIEILIGLGALLGFKRFFSFKKRQ